MLDTTLDIQTPEGIALRLRPAGPLPRMQAWLIDTMIRGVLLGVFAAPMLYFLGRGALGPLAIIAFLVTWFYPVLFEVLYSGRTPGKRYFRLRVLHDDGTPIGWTASLLRNLMRTVDFLPFLYGLGLTSMLLTRNFTRLGDIAAGSLVVHDQVNRDSVLLPEAAPLPPAEPLTPEEQQIIVAYAERAPRLSQARAEELARLAAPILHRRTTTQQDLVRIANWIRGAT